MPAATIVLICEGSCNPNLSAVDDVVHNHVQRMAPAATQQGERLSRLFDPAIVRMQRALRYTLHTCVGDSDPQCVTCSTRRRWGRTR